MIRDLFLAREAAASVALDGCTQSGPRIAFVVPGLPVAQPRQRHRIVKGAGGRVFSSNYTPKDAPVASFKARVAMACREVYSGAPLDGPLAVRLLFLLPRPKVMMWRKRPMPRVPHTSRGDVDNFAKSSLDALSDAGLWRDDAQVARLLVEKWIAAGDEQPRTEVEVLAMEGWA